MSFGGMSPVVGGQSELGGMLGASGHKVMNFHHTAQSLVPERGGRYRSSTKGYLHTCTVEYR
jgi:hypothetical protein